MAKNHFYFGVKKLPAMPQPAWLKLMGILEGVPEVDDVSGNMITPGTTGLQGSSDLRQNRFQVRHNQNVPFDAAIYEANFDDTDISILNIRQFLANAANATLAQVTVVANTQTFFQKVSAAVTFRFNGTAMFLLVVFGRSTDTQVVDWQADSLPEVQAYLAANHVEWDGV